MVSTLEPTLPVKRAQEGDQEAFATLVEHFEHEIRSYLIVHLGDYDEANDAVQQVFLKAWLNLDSLHDMACFRFWLYAIVKHQVCDYWRKKRVRTQSWEDLELDNRLAGLPGPEDNAERAELIRLTLHTLSTKQRRCLVLQNEGFTPDEIAPIVGISSASVYTYLCAARRQFRATYRQLEDESHSVLLTV
ncbi:MAG TPA: RNA polymerase sigma factor [Ktedonobacteraceae bacterium]|nr:RNA polymerase sigma factor [Ktedonobacteraceae bacterium]